MADPILPSATVFETAAIDAIVSARPSTLAQFNNPNSVYNGLPAMWRAQALVLLARLADEVKSARLKFATGDALRSLCASEFRTQLPAAPQSAVGLVSLARTGTSAGIIPQGTKFTKPANPQATPLPIQGAAYSSTAPVFVPAGQLVATVPVQASTPGTAANFPIFEGANYVGNIVPSQTLFDPTFTLSVGLASGGTSGLIDPILIAASQAHIVGQFGPTQGAAIAGLLSQQSVRHYAAFQASDFVPYASLYIADESWADCPTWNQQVAQIITNSWQGFGCRIRFGAVLNIQIAVTASFILDSSDDLSDTTGIDANVRRVAESYFNDRPDWYRFRIGSLQQLLSKADPKIRRCSSVSVTNVLTGDPMNETLNTFSLVYAPAIYHLYLTDQSVTTSYAPPD